MPTKPNLGANGGRFSAASPSAVSSAAVPRPAPAAANAKQAETSFDISDILQMNAADSSNWQRQFNAASPAGSVLTEAFDPAQAAVHLGHPGSQLSSAPRGAAPEPAQAAVHLGSQVLPRAAVDQRRGTIPPASWSSSWNNSSAQGGTREDYMAPPPRIPSQLLYPTLTPLEATLAGRSATTNSIRHRLQQQAVSGLPPQECIPVPLWSLINHDTVHRTIHPDFLLFSVLVPSNSVAHSLSLRQQAVPHARPSAAVVVRDDSEDDMIKSGTTSPSSTKRRRVRQFDDAAVNDPRPKVTPSAAKKPRLDLAWDGQEVPEKSVLQCRGVNRKRKTRCGNPALMEYVGPRPLYCAEHIESDPAAQYHKCGFLMSTLAHGREKKCKEIVFTDFKRCYKHLDDWLTPATPAADVKSALTTANRLATQLQTEAADAKSEDLELYQRKLKILRKYQSMISTLEQHRGIAKDANPVAVAVPGQVTSAVTAVSKLVLPGMPKQLKSESGAPPQQE